MNFALVHEALLVIVQELDGVLDRDHVLFALVVDLVEHGGERRRFAGTGRAGHQHESARFVAQVLHDGRKPQCVETLDLPWNGAEYRCHGAALVKDVSAETRQALQAERKVELEVLFQAVLLHVCEDAVRQRLRVGRRQRRHVQRAQLAVHADARSAVRREVQVAAPHLDHLLQQFA